MGAEVLYNEKSDVTKASGRTLSYGTGATYSVNDVARSDSVPPVMFTDEEMFSDVVSSALHLQSKKIYYEAFLVVMPLFWYRSAAAASAVHATNDARRAVTRLSLRACVRGGSKVAMLRCSRCRAS